MIVNFEVKKGDKTDLDITDIKRCLPHRFPMLLIDRVEELSPGESAVGIKCVSGNEPFFEGHFPTKPVMPGVLIIEAMAQTAGVLVMKTLKLDGNGKLVYFMSIDQAKFRQIVKPGDMLKIFVQKDRNRGNIWRFSGKAYVESKLVAEAIFTAMIVDND
ncbi:MAG: 3-hydroxyacyl-ACP dehydratase FabZ [Holosporales bacterium]|jgi:3-hydroxyacyl-[acyl-carrier-protein] dehydratase|nr:3-hydroxyacyl-ACP dehydratase FabZ [Holosporales bacterium]